MYTQILDTQLRILSTINHKEVPNIDYGITANLLKAQEKRQLGKPTNRWEDNIKPDMKEIWWAIVDWIYRIQKVTY